MVVRASGRADLSAVLPALASLAAEIDEQADEFAFLFQQLGMR